MRVFWAVVGVVTVVALGLQAQQTTQVQQKAQAQQHLQKQLQDAKVAVEYGGCPGAFSARRQSAGGMVWTVSREDAKDPAFTKRRGSSGVYVALKSARGPLREIELTVSYIAPGARVMPVGSTDAKDERKKTFELTADGTTNIDGNLLVGQAFKITQVHLVSATYANGSVWRARGEDVCSVAPDGFMLVNGK